MQIMDIARAAAEKASHDLGDYLQQIGSSQERPFAEVAEGIIKGGRFGTGCRLSLGEGAQKALETGAGRLTIQCMRPDAEIDNLRVFIDSFTGHIQILCGSSGTIVLGKLGLVRLDIRIGHDGVVLIGNGTTVNGAKLVAVNSHILVGQDGLWSDDILIQGFDQHGIVDLASRAIIKLERKDMIVGQHVLVGRRSTVMPGATIGDRGYHRRRCSGDEDGSILYRCRRVPRPGDAGQRYLVSPLDSSRSGKRELHRPKVSGTGVHLR